LLFPKGHWDGLADGSITLAFRRWKRPSVRAGGRLRVPVGVLAIDAVDRVEPAAITHDEARRAGEPDRGRLLAELARHEGDWYRVRFHYAGPDERADLARSEPDADELVELLDRLDAMDRASRREPWTRPLLALIREHPEVRAAELAAKVGRERLAFKRDVRRLKELGLTISCPIGYRLSPRGAAVLRAFR
jgi:hypothetical protein